MGYGTEHPKQREGRHVCINRSGLHPPPSAANAPGGPVRPMRHVPWAGPRFPDPSMRLRRSNDDLSLHLQSESPGCLCSICSGDDRWATEPLSLAETLIRKFLGLAAPSPSSSTPSTPSPSPLPSQARVVVGTACCASGCSSPVSGQSSARLAVLSESAQLRVPRHTRYGATGPWGHGATGLLDGEATGPTHPGSRKPMKESCLPRAGPCLLPDSCAAARLFGERMRPTSMHSR